MRARTVFTALTLVAVAVLSGCGSGSDAGGDSAKVLTKTQAKDALIGLDELGDGFRVAKDDGDDESSMGCLDKFEGVDKVVKKPKTDVEVDYEADTDIALPGVFTGLASFDSVAEAEKGMDEVRKALEDCTAVDETDKDGAHFKLTIASDDDKAGPQADEQINLSATGTLATDGITVPMAVHFAMIRIDNHVAMTGLATVSEDARADADEIAEASLARFAAVVDGKTAPKQTLKLDEVDISDFLGAGGAA